MKSLNLTTPHLIVIVGIPGSGKTYFAKQFSTTFNAPYISTDDVDLMIGNTETSKTMLNYILGKLIQTKQTLLLEGVGLTRNERQDLTVFARNKGYEPLFIWVQTEPNTAQTRATKGQNALSQEEFMKRANTFQGLAASEKYMVISGKHTYASQAKNVLKKLTEGRVSQTKTIQTKERSAVAASTQQRTGRITVS